MVQKHVVRNPLVLDASGTLPTTGLTDWVTQNTVDALLNEKRYSGRWLVVVGSQRLAQRVLQALVSAFTAPSNTSDGSSTVRPLPHGICIMECAGSREVYVRWVSAQERTHKVGDKIGLADLFI